MATQTPLAWLQSAVNRAVSFVVGLLWKPTDIPGCLLWLRPSRGVTKSGSLVSKWADQAGKHTVATPSVIERPTFVQHSDAFHQRPAIRFRADRHRPDAHPPAGPDHPCGDFSPVRDENLAKRWAGGFPDANRLSGHQSGMLPCFLGGF